MRLDSTPPVTPPPVEPIYGNSKVCPSCHHRISEDARTCPHCGHTFTTASGVFVAIIVAIVLAVLLGLLR